MLATDEAGFAAAWGIPGTVAQGALLKRLLSLRAVLAVAVAALILVAIPRSMADPDIWWHLRNAHEMLTRHAFVTYDTYSFTVKGVPWIDHEWLGEFPFYLGWKTADATGVFLVTATLILSIFLSVLWLCLKASGSTMTACTATTMAALLSTVSFGPRTLLFGWLCFTAQLVTLELFRRDARAAFALPPLYLLWVNLHGSWLIGLGVLAVVAVAGHVSLQREWLYTNRFSRQQSRMLAFAATGILPALFCNPWGWRLVAYPFNFAFRQTLNVASVEEWRSLDLHSLRGHIAIAAVALLVGRQTWRPRTWSVQEVLLLAAGLYAALTHERFLFLLALLGAPIAARSFPASANTQEPEARHGLHAALILVILATAVIRIRKDSRVADAGMKQYPTAGLMAAIDRLQPGTRVFNEYSWGGYLEWKRPAMPVFIDSRVDIFEYNGVLRDYLDAIRINGTLSLLDKYRIDAVLFEKDTPLVYLLRRVNGWQVTYEDREAVVLQRSSPMHR